MKSEYTAQNAAWLEKAEKRHAGTPYPVIPQPEDEQLVIEGMMQCLRSLKHSQRRGVVKAARDWESVIDFRIRLTMQERKSKPPRRAGRPPTTPVPPTSSPSGVRIRVSVSPSRD